MSCRLGPPVYGSTQRRKPGRRLIFKVLIKTGISTKLHHPSLYVSSNYGPKTFYHLLSLSLGYFHRRLCHPNLDHKMSKSGLTIKKIILSPWLAGTSIYAALFTTYPGRKEEEIIFHARLEENQAIVKPGWTPLRGHCNVTQRSRQTVGGISRDAERNDGSHDYHFERIELRGSALPGLGRGSR